MTTTPELAPLAVDTCVLAEATDAARRKHHAALDVLELHPNLVLPAQVVREYLVVATRPTTANGLGLSLDEARANLEAFRANMQLLPEERAVLPAFFRLLESAPCLGKRLHDAHLAATAVTHRVGGILTLNETDFAPFHAYVRTFSPGDALSLLSGG